MWLSLWMFLSEVFPPNFGLSSQAVGFLLGPFSPRKSHGQSQLRAIESTSSRVERASYPVRR